MTTMRALRWIAAVPLIVGIVFLFFGLVWTEWGPFFIGLVLVAVAAGLWRLFGGSWAIRVP